LKLDNTSVTAFVGGVEFSFLWP